MRRFKSESPIKFQYIAYVIVSALARDRETFAKIDRDLLLAPPKILTCITPGICIDRPTFQCEA